MTKTKAPKTPKTPKTTLAQKLKAKQTGIPFEKCKTNYVDKVVATLLDYIERRANPDKSTCSVSVDFLNTKGDFFYSVGSYMHGKIIDVAAGNKSGMMDIDQAVLSKADALIAYFNPRKNEIISLIESGLIAQGFNVDLRVVPLSNYRYENGIQCYELTATVTW